MMNGGWSMRNEALVLNAAEDLWMEMPLPSPCSQQRRKAWVQHKRGYCQKGGGILPPLLHFNQIQTAFSEYKRFTVTGLEAQPIDAGFNFLLALGHESVKA